MIDASTGTSTEIGTFGQFETITGLSVDAECVTPVEMTSFTASANGNSVTLYWSTATETNNQGFSVERMSANSSWQQIGFVPGFGTSASQHSYTFNDNNLNAGSYSYRLTQTDFDGTSDYSEVVNADISQPAQFSSWIRTILILLIRPLKSVTQFLSNHSSALKYIVLQVKKSHLLLMECRLEVTTRLYLMQRTSQAVYISQE